MAKKKKKRWQQNNQQKQTNVLQNNKHITMKNNIPETLKTKIDELSEDVKNSLPSMEKLEPLLGHIQDNDIKKAWIDFLKIIKKTEQDEKKIEQKQSQFEQKEEKFKEKEEVLKSGKKEFEEEKTALRKKEEDLDRLLAETNELRTKLLNNEIDSGIGMLDKITLDRYENKLKEIKTDAEKRIQELIKEHQKLVDLQKNRELELQKEYLELEERYSKRNKELEIKYIELSEKLEKKYSDKKIQLNENISKKNEINEQKETELQEKERKLKQIAREIKWDEEEIEKEKERLQNEAKDKVVKEFNGFTHKIKMLEDIIEVKDGHIEEINAKIRALGDRNPEKIVTELEKLQEKNYKLQAQLNNDINAAEKERLISLEQQKADWLPKINSLESEIAKYKAQEHKYNLQVSEIQNYKEELELIKSSKKLLEEATEELRNEVGELTKKSEGKRVFDACSQMDLEEKYQQEYIKNNEINVDDHFTKQIQALIAVVNKDVQLYYSDKVLNKFIAGLAMSRLTILQGISGTGKTSLPIAFAKAVNGGYSVIEAQSGWRDRQDLIGYYNTFEKKFYEGQFLKALYEAQTPQYKNLLYFIIIDEMNLSHPEHYFADILSLMEKSKTEQDLFIAQNVKDLPKGFQQTEKGITLRVPENVWFIGTANHDETTLQFAPKTYDRANVIELPINIEKFEIKNKKTPQFLSYTNFKTFISKKNEKNAIIKILNDAKFKEATAELGLGWGNRLEKQVSYFAKANEILGGKDEDAADHIITSKILRNLKGRYDLDKEALENLKTILIKKLGDENFESISLIEKELKRIES